MKLRTKLTASRDGSLVDATDENLITDAACAHALMLAVNHVDSPYQGLTHQAQWILRRADELMAEWGFDREKVDS